jgi:hypothetical protein
LKRIEWELGGLFGSPGDASYIQCEAANRVVHERVLEMRSIMVVVRGQRRGSDGAWRGVRSEKTRDSISSLPSQVLSSVHHHTTISFPPELQYFLQFTYFHNTIEHKSIIIIIIHLVQKHQNSFTLWSVLLSLRIPRSAALAGSPAGWSLLQRHPYTAERGRHVRSDRS